ncbi:type II toxin-antitoxin system HicB family antitoxin [Candidatus Poribacteria bacterium]|nr:MAG: type II toxin-antitoxin system HicB family antitoxin [Candidatus Poribacteria bacterium]
MLIEFIEEALKRAKFEIIDDEEPFYGEVPELEGVWATGKTLEECRENLRTAIEEWILLSVSLGLPIPRLGDVEIVVPSRETEAGKP